MVFIQTQHPILYTYLLAEQVVFREMRFSSLVSFSAASDILLMFYDDISDSAFIT